MLKNNETRKQILTSALIIVMIGIIFFCQTQKTGFHEDEIYSVATSVNPYDGLMSPYGEKDVNTLMYDKYISDDSILTEIKNAVNFFRNFDEHNKEIDKLNSLKRPVWKTREDVRKYVTLEPENYLNLKAIYYNQIKDNHPPLFYTLVHFSSILFGGRFSKYTVFAVNIISFAASCLVIKRILNLIGKENLTAAVLLFYGLSMGTVSMVIFQRMYMLLTLFILLYFYYSVKLYKNDFKLTPKLNLALGISTVLGFLTQYFFAIYAFFIFALMLIKTVKDKKYKCAVKYTAFHIVYAAIGILLFVPCLYHLLLTDRGISNLANTGYFHNLLEYAKHLFYSFAVGNNVTAGLLITAALFAGVIYLYRKSNEKFIISLTVIPGIFYFFVAVNLTSFQELRYIMPVLPFVAITVFLVLNVLLRSRRKELVMVLLAAAVVTSGFVFSKPKFLYEDYRDCLEIAQTYKDRSFVYVYDNTFNHIQSVPEMMIYEKTMIININKDEINCFTHDETLNSEDSYILCIKSYLDNESILNDIRDNTDFKNFTLLYQGSNFQEAIGNNLYLCSK